jgi:hypothetical protein
MSKEEPKTPQELQRASGAEGGPGKQNEDSRQSAGQSVAAQQQKADTSKGGAQTGIGSSQGQDKETRQSGDGRSGTADIERDAARSQDSLVNDPTGAYKERP